MMINVGGGSDEDDVMMMMMTTTTTTMKGSRGLWEGKEKDDRR